MAEPLKNVYSQKFFDRFIKTIQPLKTGFNEDQFLQKVYSDQWNQLELKERMRHISLILDQFLYKNYKENIALLCQLVDELEKQGLQSDNFGYLFLPDFVEVYGLDDLETSIIAMERITQFMSCEFAVRPFIIQYPTEMNVQMNKWSKHSNPWVRRLSTEGYRPRLPWAMALPALKKDPSPILPILERLKNDESESVRRSVANNLNDISKDHPNIVIDLAEKWKGESPEIDWIIKHACRSLLKQGIPELFGFGSIDKVNIQNFSISTPKVKMGDYLEFSFDLNITSHSKMKIRLEYGLYYQKANGTLSKKVFQISEKEYHGNSITSITRKKAFKPIYTRKHY